MRIFIVYLKGSPRRLKIAADLEAVGLPFEFFDAVDARKGVPAQYKNRINRTRAKIRLLRKMTDVEFGCALSHALLYEKIVRENISDAIILEDDAILTADFVKIVKNNALEKSDIDMAFLYHNECCVRKKQYFLKGIPYQKPVFMPCGTVGYYINLPVAKALHRATKTISYVADYPVSICKKFNTVSFYPLLIAHPHLEEKQSLIMNTEPADFYAYRNTLWYKLLIGSGLFYFCNRSYYGSFWRYLQQHHLRKRFIKKFFKNEDIYCIS